MRVLMLNYEYPPLGGGAGNATFNLLNEFTKRDDITVDLVTSSAHNRFEKERRADNITLYKLPVPKKSIHYWRMGEILVWSISAYRLCRHLIKVNTYTLQHCWFGWPSGILGYLNRKEVPYIVGLRGSDIPGYNTRLKILDSLFFGYISKIVWKHAEKVTVLSEDSLKMAKKILDRDYIIIRNGVNTSDFFPIFLHKSTIKILTVGRLIERKGIEYTIRGFADIRKNNPGYQVHLTIVGSGKLEKQLKDLTHELHIADNVSFLGGVEHEMLPDIYRDHDIFVLSSLNEALGNVTQEAIASGLALITTETGAAELLDGNGFIVKKCDFQDISEKLSILIKNPHLLSRFKKRSVEISERMSWKECADSYLKIYHSSVKEKE